MPKLHKLDDYEAFSGLERGAWRENQSDDLKRSWKQSSYGGKMILQILADEMIRGNNLIP